MKPTFAVTGCIAAGKSTFAHLLGESGLAVVDADELARIVVAPGGDGLKSIVKKFGKGILLSDGALNRKALGEIVFGNATERAALEEILHPLIREAWLAERAKQLLNQSTWGVLYSVPLILDSRQPYPEINGIIVVHVSHETAKQRLMSRNTLTSEQAEHRLQSQLSSEYKRQGGDFIVQNEGDRSALQLKATRLAALLKSRWVK